MVFLFVLVTNPEIQDGGPRWPPFGNGYAIITSCDVITSQWGRQRRHFQTYYLPSKCRCHSFYMERAEPPPPPIVEDQKKSGLNRINY